MKCFLFLLVMLFVGFFSWTEKVWSQETTGPFDFGFQTGVDVPGWSRPNIAGFGEGAWAGYELDSKFSLRLAVQHFSFSSIGGSDDELRISPSLKISSAHENKMGIYAFLGPVADTDFSNLGPVSAYFGLELGVGFRVDVTDHIHWYVQGSDNIVFANQTTHDFPVLAGVDFN